MNGAVSLIRRACRTEKKEAAEAASFDRCIFENLTATYR
jgi:hypothetical protein